MLPWLNARSNRAEAHGTENADLNRGDKYLKCLLLTTENEQDIICNFILILLAKN